MAGSIDGDIQFFLQRRAGTGAWTIIATSSQLDISIPDIPDSDTSSGDITATFNAATLNWATGAQYRILVRRDLDDTATSVNITSAETRVYSVSTA